MSYINLKFEPVKKVPPPISGGIKKRKSTPSKELRNALSKRSSSVVNVINGFGVGLIAQDFIFPNFNIPATTRVYLTIAIILLVLSIYNSLLRKRIFINGK